MSADIVEYVDQKFRSGNSVPIERAHLSVDEWAQLRAEIVRLRGELDVANECLGEYAAREALHYQAIAPAEAKGDFPEDALAALRGYRQADMEGVFVTVSREALDMAIERLGAPKPAGGEAVAWRWLDRGDIDWRYSAAHPGYCNAEPLYTTPPAAQVQGKDHG